MGCRESGRGPGFHAFGRGRIGRGSWTGCSISVGVGSGSVGSGLGTVVREPGTMGDRYHGRGLGYKKAPTPACQQGGSSRAGKRSKNPATPAPSSSQQPGAGSWCSSFQYSSGVQSNKNFPDPLSASLASSRVNRSSSGPDRKIPISVPRWHVAMQYFLSVILVPLL